jgi:hypothetical protein
MREANSYEMLSDAYWVNGADTGMKKIKIRAGKCITSIRTSSLTAIPRCSANKLVVVQEGNVCAT